MHPLRRTRTLLKRLWPSRENPLSPTTEVGLRGEREAAKHLKGKGYKILERNYRVKQGEIDLVAFRDGVLAFVEVRAQTRPALIDPLLTITRRKQRRIIKAAQSYATLNDLQTSNVALRFDVVTVLFDAQGRPDQINHMEGAFQESSKGFS